MTLEIQILARGRHRKVAGFNPSMRCQTSPLDNLISNGSTDINKKQMKLLQLRFHINKMFCFSLKTSKCFGKYPGKLFELSFAMYKST